MRKAKQVLAGPGPREPPVLAEAEEARSAVRLERWTEAGTVVAGTQQAMLG